MEIHFISYYLKRRQREQFNLFLANNMDAAHFVFEGFLPAKGAAREQRLKELATETRTIIFYESPHRIEDLISQLIAACGALRTGAP